MELTVIRQKDELVERCKAGEGMAYKALYQRYCKAMYNTCCRLLNNDAEAEDVLQDSFVEAFKNLHAFEYRSSFGGWLKQICINRCINQLNKRKVNWVNLEEVAVVDIDPDVFLGEEETALKIVAVKKAMSKMAEGYRTVLSLYLFEGYDHDEIAHILQIAATTSRTQYSRAKQKLLELLKGKK